MVSDIDEHGDRTASLARLLCEQMGLDRATTRRIANAARTHDIGKRALPHELLDKPAALTRDERLHMHLHCALGARLLTPDAPDCTPEEAEAAAVALLHHEWWNGRGYPCGLIREQIPLAARIVAVADVFDALVTARPYKIAWPRDLALSHIRARRGIQFDPRCAQALMDVAGALPQTVRTHAALAGCCV